MTHVGLVCRDQLLRDLLASHLERRGFTVACTAATTDKLLATGRHGDLDLLVLQPEDEAPDRAARLIAQLRDTCKGTRLVLLTRRDDLDLQLASIRAEADGTLHSDISATALVESLALVMAGERVYPAFLLQEMLSRPSAGQTAPAERDQADPTRLLSQTERRVLTHLMTGSSNKEIARVLGISESTVKVHVRRICRLTGSNNRTQAAMWAHQHDVGIEEEPGSKSPAKRNGRLRIAANGSGHRLHS